MHEGGKRNLIEIIKHTPAEDIIYVKPTLRPEPQVYIGEKAYGLPPMYGLTGMKIKVEFVPIYEDEKEDEKLL